MLYKAKKINSHKIILLEVGNNKLPYFFLCFFQLKAIFALIKSDFNMFLDLVFFT